MVFQLTAASSLTAMVNDDWLLYMHAQLHTDTYTLGCTYDSDAMVYKCCFEFWRLNFFRPRKWKPLL